MTAALFTAALAERMGDPAADIAGVEARLRQAFEPKPIAVLPSLKDRISQATQITPAWPEVEIIWTGLTWQNQRTAKARAMLHYAAGSGR